MGLAERRQREKYERKKQILASARTLLIEKGFQAITIQQIANLAELSVGTIYIYYKSKEEIFAALQEEGLQILYNDIRKFSLKGKTYREKLINIGKCYANFSQQHRDYFNIINYFLTSPETFFREELKQRVDNYAGEIVGVCREIIEAGISNEEFKQVPSWHYAIIYMSSVHGILQFNKISGVIFEKVNIGFSEFVFYQIEQLVNCLFPIE